MIEVILKAIKKGHEGTIQLDNQKAPKNSESAENQLRSHTKWG